MSDRELLEAAAKAIGFDLHINLADAPQLWKDGKYVQFWNPLQDDGDALRLAVKLQLQITPGTYNKDEFSAFHAGRGEANEYWSGLQDEYAATRRAIVRAAAQIAQGKEGEK